MQRGQLHVVLVSPRMPGNVGTIGRTCVGFGAHLHVCGPLGFALDDKALARAQIDYWHLLSPVKQYMHWVAFETAVGATVLERQAWFFSRHATKPLALGAGVDLATTGGADRWLVFGSEQSGLHPLLGEERMARYASRLVQIPMAHAQMRCHNLSTSVAIALWEQLRQCND